ncbi:MAG: STAS domain-containing protein [Parvibaculales bacterium]
MTFQLKRDRNSIINLKLVGDIDLEVTPEIKTRLNNQLEDAVGLHIDARNVSYIDSSGVSILIIAMHMCKKNGIELQITAISDEVHKVLKLARLDKLLPLGAVTGPAQIVDVDVFTKVSPNDAELAGDLDMKTSLSDDTLADDTLPDDTLPDDTLDNMGDTISETNSNNNDDDDDLIAALADELTEKQAAKPPIEKEKSDDEPPASHSDNRFKPGTFS